MNANQIAESLTAFLSEAANMDADEMADAAASVAEEVTGALTFAKAGILSSNSGLVIRTADGREFQITVVRSK